MRKRASFDGATGVRHQQLRRRPALLGGATRVGNFDERQWGISASAVKAACQIDEVDGRYVCRLSPSQRQLQGDELRTHFLNLVTDENLREKVGRETDRLRDVIVALAFG